MALPEPVISHDDIMKVEGQCASMIWNSWSQDPTKAAVLQAVLPWYKNLVDFGFLYQIVKALSHRQVCFSSSLLIGSGGSTLLKIFRSLTSFEMSSMTSLTFLK